MKEEFFIGLIIFWVIFSVGVWIWREWDFRRQIRKQKEDSDRHVAEGGMPDTGRLFKW